MTQDGWRALRTELGKWQPLGLRPTFWWRDDDANQPTPALDRLLDICRRHAVPLALAVIPKDHSSGLRDACSTDALVTMFQHGWAHSDHSGWSDRSDRSDRSEQSSWSAQSEQSEQSEQSAQSARADRLKGKAKKIELGSQRSLDAVCEELSCGSAMLAQTLGDSFKPVLVPPWNRIAREVTALLPGLGFTGLSTYAARAAREPMPGLRQVNCHFDIINWRSRQFAGDAVILAELCNHLEARRLGQADTVEPSGLLTHHLVQSDQCWYFLERLFAESKACGAEWIEPQWN